MKQKFLLIFLLLCISITGCTTNDKSEILHNNSSSILEDKPKISEQTTTDTNNESSATIHSYEADLDEESLLFLKDVYKDFDLMAGTCLSPEMINNPDAKKLILEQFNSITMENAMKPEYILNHKKSQESGEIVVEFNQDAIDILNWCKQNNMSMRGHTLIWYSQTPDWIFYEDFDETKAFVSRDVMLSRMESFIKQVFEFLINNNYSDLFYAYDVVNEALMEDGNMRDNNYRTIIGDDYLWHAFNYSRIYAPDNIKLFYNDYNEQYKARALVDFVNTLVDSDGNYLIDGIGLQAHLYTLDDMNKYIKAIDILSQTGLTLEITELDVSLGTWQNTLEPDDTNLKAQGKFYYNLINAITEKKAAGTLNLDSITFWGFNDSLSWRKEAAPLLFDKDNNPKYSFYGAALSKDKAGF